jgi:hypothetical protein
MLVEKFITLLNAVHDVIWRISLRKNFVFGSHHGISDLLIELFKLDVALGKSINPIAEEGEDRCTFKMASRDQCEA